MAKENRSGQWQQRDDQHLHSIHTSLDLNCLKLLPDGIQFYPSQLAKQSRPSKSVATFIFPAFPTDKKLCTKIYYRPSGSNQVGVAVLSCESTDSLQTSR